MKLLAFLLIFFPAFCNAQCPQWIGSSKDSVIDLLNKADSYLQFNLMSKYDTAQSGRIHLADDHSYCTFDVSFNQSSAFVGNDIVTKYTTVKSINISGPTERVDKFIAEYLMPSIQTCDIQKGGQWLHFGKTIMVTRGNVNAPIESINMSYRESMQ